MIIRIAEFVKSCKELKNCPTDNKPEYAFIGRSNVGKSSVINLLVNKKHLAKTSATPGKTQLINFFNINDEWFLVDLPGIGYAKTSKVNRADWQKMIFNYLEKRKSLMNSFILIDSRHTLLKSDTELIDWFGKKNLPFSIIFTKSDKLSQNELMNNVYTYKKHLLEYWEELPQIFISSAFSGLGKDDILDYIEKTNKLFNDNDIRN